MIDQKQAEEIVKKELPSYEIVKQANFNNSFIFLMQPPDEEFPTFFKVSIETGSFTDFSPWDEPDPVAFEQAFLT